MGKVFSIITRPIKNFNIESRAHKIISKDKPTPAPKYKADIKQTEKLLKDHPETLEELNRKDAGLDARLKDIYVKSHDPMFNIKKNEDSDRPLPLNRKIVEHFEFGFKEPVSVPIGRCTLRQAVTFLTKHQEDTNLWNSAKIALEYKIPEDTIRNILHYFRVYKVYIPDKKFKLILAEPIIPKQRQIDDPLKKLLEEEKK